MKRVDLNEECLPPLDNNKRSTVGCIQCLQLTQIPSKLLGGRDDKCFIEKIFKQRRFDSMKIEGRNDF